MQRADLLGVFDVNGASLRDVESKQSHFTLEPRAHLYAITIGGRARI